METLLSTNPKDEAIYNNVKILILKCIKDKYLKMDNPNDIVRKTISDCLTLIIISGIFYNWQTCIQELINERIHQNIKYIFIVLRALGSIDTFLYSKNELLTEDNYDDDLIILQSNKIQIKEKLYENKDIVIDFLLNIYNNINNIQNENLRQIMITQLFDTTRCWTNFNLNLLKSINISEMIFKIMEKYNINNVEYFSDMISDSISNSNNAHIYKNIENDSPEKLSQELLKLIDLEEKKGLDFLLSFIFKKLDQLKNKENSLNHYEKKLLKEFAKVLASIIENYIYFFFNFNDKKSVMVLNWFSYFLKYKKRNISWLFFEGLSEMKSFINDYYKFYGLNQEQKIEFVNYLMDIVYGVMENCSYSKLDQKDISLLEQEILCNNNELCFDYQKPNNINENKDLEDLDENEDIDLNEYRTNADSVFSSIFFILIINFKDYGTSQFLNKILSALNFDEIKGKTNVKDQYLDIKIDVIFFVISSVIEIFEMEQAENSINIIHKMLKEFLNSKIILENQRIFIDFIVFINKFAKNLVTQPDNFKNVMDFLLLVSKRSNNQIIIDSCYIVLLNICKEINDNIKIDDSFINEVFNLYKETYKKYQYPNIKPLEKIIQILLSIAGVNQSRIPEGKGPKENLDYDPNLKNVIENISFPINNQIKNILEEYIKNNQNTNIKRVLKLEILKSYFLQGKILVSLKEFSKPLSDYFLQVHLKETLNSTKIIFDLFQEDKDIIQPLIDFYASNASDIGDSCHNNFNLFNDILINYFLSSENHYKVVEVIKLLYLSFLISIDKTSELYSKNNKYILDQYCLIMNNLINSISKENKINEIIKEKIKIISDFHYFVFNKLYIDFSPIIQKNELIKYYNFIQNVITFFIKCISLFQNCDINEPINELIISSIINSFNVFFINISLSKDFMTKKNDNN